MVMLNCVHERQILFIKTGMHVPTAHYTLFRLQCQMSFDHCLCNMCSYFVDYLGGGGGGEKPTLHLGWQKVSVGTNL
jgi:hypothetical protein